VLEPKKNSKFYLIVFLLINFFSIACSAKETNAKSPYVDLYDKVWLIIQKDYVDSSFNGQDWNIWRHRYDEYIHTEKDYPLYETIIPISKRKISSYLLQTKNITTT
jgi:hypothetical protein